MNQQQYTHRLLGAIVLLSLAIIFIPMVLNLDRRDILPTGDDNIPEMPEKVSTLVYKLDRDGVFKSADQPPSLNSSNNDQDANSVNPVTQTAIASAPAAPEVDVAADGATMVWMVQIGTFSRERNATALMNKLRKKDYATFLDSYESEGETLWRLKVGPEMSVKRAETLKHELEKETGLKGLLVRHH
jgi:DedD protein